ncbi:undecaprenyl phosphate N,N'-diacetylbacillosamine 1-phosphate transferase [Campylobacter sp. IFREMER_LSEM_CL1846]|uniref:undecaprenyl phosphate N,N'-diacetylbacillosamine 1-phosphate transferase n=1 Tax=Campylobacter sp. IFREMER_LSEM_CL1846 TaxID=2911614 RepID=UPI0021E6C290|nr:undecaprenyl phosphate N,N'-diacetylbacillosamine 1-phosphate transferase [Campylobacter sp. IFREMER_LSEM_CL1846]HEC1747475.1 undecaprenyl phosphate N,N'-diacetylbacillosamine 1-phosphate transferase [Campylobacter lari]MCV3434635.1 undecaprenyl phosphate N,N'-diacetylbacillosamine 1-phosphate transferase [Campylobacter sp. IFREMER_LSEM_CL1846]HEC1767947.1 undecaprenyl phosphate N,N'-diacetylbacillosamine 1-phosphate transferase [Campylobacter lari]HEC1788486.1 undecaprenyl phosphate N,N'-di
MYKNGLKRVFDFFLALILLIIFLPFIVLIGIVLKIVQGSVLFKQARPGLNEKIFYIYKFKTMSDETDENGELLPDELRLKPFGKLVRSLSLDELPQLFNVLKGDMSFIGPRPLLVEYLPLYNQEQKKRHDVRPGITGWAQINGRNTISWEQKFKYDVEYVQNCSFLFDLKIFFMTIIKVLKRSGVNKEGVATTDKFNGHN